jgi:DNA-binding GntR family transcriptional regulator
VGGARPSVNQVLRRLADEGLVEVRRGRIIVGDPARLAGLAT